MAKASGLDGDEGDRLKGVAKSIAEIEDHWTAFERLRKLLGRATYVASIRDALQVDPSIPIPDGYRSIWRLRVGGVLTLNLDRFSVRAFAEEKGPGAINEMTGRELGTRLHVLKSPSPFVVNLHGIVDDAMSWVLTQTDFESLYRTRGYQTFLSSVFATRTVLFLGITADDVAAGGFLARLRQGGFDPGQHFWLTNRCDAATDSWAEKAGIQVIRYEAMPDHATALKAFFDGLLSFVPQDQPPPPVGVPEDVDALTSPLPEPNELARSDPEQIRKVLAAETRRILSGKATDQEALRQYDKFCGEYRRAIHNAWLVDANPPDNMFLGYMVEEQIGRGLFGHVYRARDSKGEPVVIKLLRQENFGDTGMVGSFRRGVRSLRILGARRVPGVVMYKAAYELPACVIMEFVEGPDLKQAVDARQLEIRDKLRIAFEVAQIVRVGHLLPERVLHRDIRPPNVMLRGFYQQDTWDVVVLDFDLSWHRGAPEKSVVVPGSFAPYLAPEQLQDTKGVSTRSAAVDSFGLGMTLYFLLVEEEPRLGDLRDDAWVASTAAKIRAKFENGGRSIWTSLPTRLARLVQGATAVEQARRLDMAQIESELHRLREVVADPGASRSAELWAEELFARAFDGYRWDHTAMSAMVQLPSGVALRATGHEVTENIELRIQWLFSGDSRRKSVSKYLPAARDRAVAVLRRAGWAISSSKAAGYEVLVSATTTVANARNQADELSCALTTAAREIQFD